MFVVVVVVVVTFQHQAEGIAPIEILVLIPLFSAIGAITENGPCTHYSLLKFNIRWSHMNDRIRLLSPKGWEKSISPGRLLATLAVRK